MSVVDIHLRKLPWICRSGGKWPSRHTGGQSNHHKWLASRKIWSVEELETLPAGTKPSTSHYRSPGRERRGKRKCWNIFLKGRERAIVNQTNIGTVSKTTLGKLLTEWSVYGLFQAHRYHLELDRTKLNWSLKELYLSPKGKAENSVLTLLGFNNLPKHQQYTQRFLKTGPDSM